MNISEEEKKQILSKYEENTSDEVLNYLKRRFKYVETKFDWMNEPIRTISFHGKTYTLTGNKKFLVSKLSSIAQSEFNHIPEPTIRRTVKKYIDGIRL